MELLTQASYLNNVGYGPYGDSLGSTPKWLFKLSPFGVVGKTSLSETVMVFYLIY